ncbi:MAG TPA: L,D-transpeptidase family protein [Actinomycetota bacterium]|nr:L,D-transpeptidase family protein [Actinomycetota bacterium]
MKILGAVARFVSIAVVLAAAALGTGAMVGSPSAPVIAEASEVRSPEIFEPQLTIEPWDPQPDPEPVLQAPEEPIVEQTPPPAPPVEAPAEPARPPAPSSARALRSGDSGPEVSLLESRLKALGYDPGRVNETFDQYTRFAVISFQKVAGLTVDGLAGPAVLAALEHPPAPKVLNAGGAPNRVEVDLGLQLMVVYRDGSPVLITHVSTGSNETFCSSGRCRRAETPEGSFRFLRRISGWRTAELGRLYNPVYFTDDGVAVHGSASVPLEPASHGCVRIPMHTADLFPRLVSNGTDIHLSQ